MPTALILNNDGTIEKIEIKKDFSDMNDKVKKYFRNERDGCSVFVKDYNLAIFVNDTYIDSDKINDRASIIAFQQIRGTALLIDDNKSLVEEDVEKLMKYSLKKTNKYDEPDWPQTNSSKIKTKIKA